MGPELETTGRASFLTALLGRDPGCSAQAFPKSLIYNISLMAGQTWAYEFTQLGTCEGSSASPDRPNEKVSFKSGCVTLDCKPMVTCVIVLGRIAQRSGSYARLAAIEGRGRIDCMQCEPRPNSTELDSPKKGYGTLKRKSSNRMRFSPNDLFKARYAPGALAAGRNVACPRMVKEKRG
jgi:hypothetical protein